MKRGFRILSLLLVLAMVLSMGALAVDPGDSGRSGAGEDSVRVYFSVSHDDQFRVGPESGTVMALREIEVPYFDLGLYGLQDYYFMSEDYGPGGPDGGEDYDGKVTMLHLFIYATEVYYCGLSPAEAGQGYLYDANLLGTDVMTITGSAGSTYLNQFWGQDENLNYYLNYEYPLAAEGWGATSDQILLRDGDVVTMGHFTSWSFYTDPASGFNYIRIGGETGAAAVDRGDAVTLELLHAGADMTGNYTTVQSPLTTQPTVYIAAAEDLPDGDVTAWEPLGQADEAGMLELDTGDLAPGTYVLAVPGQPGAEYPEDICSTPGGIRLTVRCGSHTYASSVTREPTCTQEGERTYVCTACGDTYTEAIPKTDHDYTATVTAPTCEKEGFTVYKCENCGYSYTGDVTPATGHSYTLQNAKAAACTEKGYTGDRICSVCGHVGERGQDIPAKGHAWGGWTLTQEAGCFHDGAEKRLCAACGEAETRAVAANAENCPSKAFKDLNTNSWYHEGVDFVLDTGLMVGTGKTTFSPNDNLTRGQLVTILYRLAGEPSVAGLTNGFTDVKPSAYYGDAVLWAEKLGVVQGVGGGKFQPEAKITRQDMVTILYRYAKLAGYDVTAKGDLKAFPDRDKTSAYAAEPMSWAVAQGIITGDTAGGTVILSPKGTTTRAQLAAIMQRFVEKTAKAYTDIQ